MRRRVRCRARLLMLTAAGYLSRNLHGAHLDPPTEPGTTVDPYVAPPTPSVERVSTLELFFDLVFVFTITQVTHLVGHAHGATDFLRSLLALAVVWWMYGGYAWLTSNIGTGRLRYRLLMLAGMGAFLVLAMRIPEIGGRHGVAFGAAYAVVVVVHAALFRAAPNTSARAILGILPFNLTLAVLVIVSGIVPVEWNWLPWLAAGAAIAASTLARRERGFHLAPAHFAERHGLVMLVAIGESVVAIGTGAADIPFTWALVTAAVLGFALAAALWWCYFDGDDARAEHALAHLDGAERARAALYAYYHAHFVMIAGIVVAAAGVHGVIGDIGLPTAGAAVWLLAAGVAVYLLGETMFRRILRIGPIGGRLVVAALAIVSAPLGLVAGSLAQLGVLVALLVVMLLVERRIQENGAAAARGSSAAIAGAVILLAATVPAAGGQIPARQGVDAQVPLAPSPVWIGGVRQLVYELHVTNFASSPVSLRRLQVLADAATRPIGSFDGSVLEAMVGRVGLVPAPSDRLRIEPGMRVVLYLNLPLDAGVVPRVVRHRLELETTVNERHEDFAVEGARVAVDRSPLPELGPPLRGGPWAAVYDPMLERGHRRVIYAVDGHARIPGRFAIDWFRVDEQGRIAREQSGDVADYLGHGADVLAVANGIVVATRDDVAEPRNVRDAPRTSIADATGNYIALDIGGGRYVFYEHLAPGLRVKKGQRVRRGQVIAALGFTGQGTAPHLHLHVSDANSPLAAEGRPYRLRGYRVLGGYSSLAAVTREPWVRSPGTASRSADLPAPNTVVEFVPR